MDNEKVLYSSQTYNLGLSFLFAVPVFLAPTALIIIIARYLHSEAFGVIGAVTVLLVPFLFQNGYKRLFTRRMELEFDNEYFLIKEYKIKSDVFVKESIIAWTEIKIYKCFFSSSNVFYLVLYLRDGSTKRFSFKDEKDQEQAFKEKSAISIFYNYVRQYNLGQQSEREITLNPGFITTKYGAFFLYSLSVFIVASIIILLMLAPSAFYLPFPSFFIIMGLLLKRRRDKALYYKINHLEPGPPIV